MSIAYAQPVAASLWSPYTPPATPSTDDDEFTGSGSGLPGTWVARRFDTGATFVPTNGGIGTAAGMTAVGSMRVQQARRPSCLAVQSANRNGGVGTTVLHGITRPLVAPIAIGAANAGAIFELRAAAIMNGIDFAASGGDGSIQLLLCKDNGAGQADCTRMVGVNFSQPQNGSPAIAVRHYNASTSGTNLISHGLQITSLAAMWDRLLLRIDPVTGGIAAGHGNAAGAVTWVSNNNGPDNANIFGGGSQLLSHVAITYGCDWGTQTNVASWLEIDYLRRYAFGALP